MTAPLDDRPAVILHVEAAIACVRRAQDLDRVGVMRGRLLEMAGAHMLDAARDDEALSGDLSVLSARLYDEAERWPLGDGSALQAILEDLETIAKELRRHG